MYRNRKQATDYIRERGIPCGDSFLAHQAVTATAQNSGTKGNTRSTRKRL